MENIMINRVSPIYSGGGIYIIVGEIVRNGKTYGILTDTECSSCDLTDVSPYTLTEEEQEEMFYDIEWYNEHHVEDFSEDDGAILYKRMMGFIFETEPDDDWCNYDIYELERIYRRNNQ